jgi:hypothetical protein
MPVSMSMQPPAHIIVSGANVRLPAGIMNVAALLHFNLCAGGCAISLILRGQNPHSVQDPETPEMYSESAYLDRAKMHEMLGRAGAIKSNLATDIAFGDNRGPPQLHCNITERLMRKLVEVCRIHVECAWAPDTRLWVSVIIDESIAWVYHLDRRDVAAMLENRLRA